MRLIRCPRMVWVFAVGLLALSVLIGGCGGEGGEGPAKLMLGTEVVFVGEIIEVGPPPAFWSGRFEARQLVRYRVLSVTVGDLKVGSEVAVLHLVVRGSATASSTAVGLSEELFHVGNKLEVQARVGEAPEGDFVLLVDEDSVAIFQP